MNFKELLINTIFKSNDSDSEYLKLIKKYYINRLEIDEVLIDDYINTNQVIKAMFNRNIYD